jgi:hypothetical protein
MAVPTPDLTLTVTTPSGTSHDYTKYMAWGGAINQLTITQNFGRQGDTANIPLVDDFSATGTQNLSIPVMSRVKLVDNNLAGKVLFAGVINDPTLVVQSPTLNEWDLKCTDYTFYADNIIVNGTFNGFTVDQIVVKLTQQANCGITAKTVKNGGFVAPGPQLATFVLNYVTLADAWRKLATLASQSTPYGWYVDENRDLHFYDASTAINSGVTFTTTPTAVNGSSTQGHLSYDSFTYEWDGTSVRNRILVQGANQIIKHTTPPKGKPTDIFAGDGTRTSWPLRYTLNGTPILYVRGKKQTVTVVSAGESGSGTWQATQNRIGQWFLVTTGAAPGRNVQLKVWYSYEVPVVAQANDHASQVLYNGPNRGIFEEYINDTTLTTVPMALARAMRERTEYAFAPERFTFNTTEDWYGWVRSGETFRVTNKYIPDASNNYSWGLTNEKFLCTGNSITFVSGGYRVMQITSVRI